MVVGIDPLLLCGVIGIAGAPLLLLLVALPALRAVDRLGGAELTPLRPARYRR